jgi:hypothetical protein
LFVNAAFSRHVVCFVEPGKRLQVGLQRLLVLADGRVAKRHVAIGIRYLRTAVVIDRLELCNLLKIPDRFSELAAVQVIIGDIRCENQCLILRDSAAILLLEGADGLKRFFPEEQEIHFLLGNFSERFPRSFVFFFLQLLVVIIAEDPVIGRIVKMRRISEPGTNAVARLLRRFAERYLVRRFPATGQQEQKKNNERRVSKPVVHSTGFDAKIPVFRRCGRILPNSGGNPCLAGSANNGHLPQLFFLAFQYDKTT